MTLAQKIVEYMFTIWYDLPIDSAKKSDLGVGLAHGLWMMLEIKNNQMEEDREQRWLGYAQCILVYEGVCTLDELRDVTRKMIES